MIPARRDPQSKDDLLEDLLRLGVGPGDTLLVHSSMSRLGFVIGGQVAVVHALLEGLGEAGTLVVPAHTADNSDPSRWSRTRKSAVPETWWPKIRENLPGFDADRTPSYGMGCIAETVRTWPGAVRSAHPQTSFAALGPRAAEICSGHEPDCLLGESSPLGVLAGLAQSKILLLGVGYRSCTAFHLGEYRQTHPRHKQYHSIIRRDGHTESRVYADVALSDDDFDLLGSALESSELGASVAAGHVGQGWCRLLPLAQSVDFATEWMANNRDTHVDAGPR